MKTARKMNNSNTAAPVAAKKNATSRQAIPSKSGSTSPAYKKAHHDAIGMLSEADSRELRSIKHSNHRISRKAK